MAKSMVEELQQTKPFPSLGQEAVVAMLRTTDMLRRLIAEVLAPFEITPQQYNVLRILRGAGVEGLPTLTIGERMMERTPGVTRIIDRLAAKGWVRRERCDRDRRRVYCTITVSGLELLDELDGLVRTGDLVTVANLKEGEVEELLRILAEVREGLREALKD